MSVLVGFTGTNNLAYLASSLVRKNASFKILTTFVNVLKSFFVIERQNRLERFSVASTSTQWLVL
jgi:hypothetical protein